MLLANRNEDIGDNFLPIGRTIKSFSRIEMAKKKSRGFFLCPGKFAENLYYNFVLTEPWNCDAVSVIWTVPLSE